MASILHTEKRYYHSASPLTELPDTPPPELAPQTAAATGTEQSPSKRPTTKKPKDKKQIIDSIIELKDGPGIKTGRNRNGGLGSQVQKDVSNILTDVSLYYYSERHGG